MSPALIAHLARVGRRIRADVAADNAIGPRGGRLTNVTDFYRPAELVRKFRHHRP